MLQPLCHTNNTIQLPVLFLLYILCNIYLVALEVQQNVINSLFLQAYAKLFLKLYFLLCSITDNRRRLPILYINSAARLINFN
jgi:hypothetical protein